MSLGTIFHIFVPKKVKYFLVLCNHSMITARDNLINLFKVIGQVNQGILSSRFLS